MGRCFEDAGAYGRYVIASGPYMIEGQPDLDTSSCESMKPLRGYDPQDRMTLVRNPGYDPATDVPEARESFPDEFDFVLDANVKDIFDKIAAGELESAIVAQPPLSVLRRYSTDDSLRPLLHRNFSDAVAYINFVLTAPPFDDVHVRRAVNFVMDKAGLQRAAGGSLASAIATHIMPPSLTNGHPTAAEYDPYATPDSQGDVDAAKSEMRQSIYDTNHDGICDAPACKDVLHYTANVSPWTDIEALEEESLAKIGITLDTRELADFYTPWQTISKSPPISSGAVWGKDYPDPYTYLGALFSSSAISPVGNTNASLVGLTPETARKNHIEGDVSGVPSVDAEVAECSRLIGPKRTSCWIDLDKKLMEEVVPWVPWAWFFHVDVLSPAVTKYEFDQFSGLTGFAHVAVDQSKQQAL